ncbi:hypothetical protein BDW68DRAFT_162658 [Aspergillus falconensis]
MASTCSLSCRCRETEFSPKPRSIPPSCFTWGIEGLSGHTSSRSSRRGVLESFPAQSRVLSGCHGPSLHLRRMHAPRAVSLQILAIPVPTGLIR